MLRLHRKFHIVLLALTTCFCFQACQSVKPNDALCRPPSHQVELGWEAFDSVKVSSFLSSDCIIIKDKEKIQALGRLLSDIWANNRVHTSPSFEAWEPGITFQSFMPMYSLSFRCQDDSKESAYFEILQTTVRPLQAKEIEYVVGSYSPHDYILTKDNLQSIRTIIEHPLKDIRLDEN